MAGLVPRRASYPSPSLVEKRWKELVGDFAPELIEYIRKLLTEMDKTYGEIYKAFLKSWYPMYDETDVSNPPTDAELDAIFGTPAQVGVGFTAIVNDAGGGSNVYFVWSDGTYWWYTAGTKAT